MSLGARMSLLPVREVMFKISKMQLAHLVKLSFTPTKVEDSFEDPQSLTVIEINRQRATKAKNKGSAESKIQHSIFGQVASELRGAEPRQLRRSFVHPLDDGQMRTFKVKFTGEGVVDNGGPYREIFNECVDELQSDHLPLLIRCPNSRSDQGINRDKWIVNPACTRYPLYRFMGKLMGIALRNRIAVGFHLAGIVWKKSAGHRAVARRFGGNRSRHGEALPRP